MILAALIPCSLRGQLGLVIVEHGANGVAHLLVRHRAEVGHLERLVEPAPTERADRKRDMRRVVTKADVDELARLAVHLLAAYDCRDLIIEPPTNIGISGDRSARTADAVRQLADAANVTVIEGSLEGHRQHVDPAELEALVGWPRGLGESTDTERRAALLAMRGVGGADENQHSIGGECGRSDHDRDDHGGRPDNGDVCDVASGELALGESGSSKSGNPTDHDSATAAAIAPSPTKLGPRTGAVDPGSAWVGVTIVEGLAFPLTLIASKLFEFGTWDPKLKRRSFADADVDTLVDDIAVFFRSHDVDFAVVERVEAAQRSRDAIAAQKRTTEIARAQWIGGEIRRELKHQGFEMHKSASASTWRSKVAVGGWRKDDPQRPSARARVLMGIRRVVEGWPAGTGGRVHEEDACGLAIYDVRRTATAIAAASSATVEATGAPKKRQPWRGQREANRRCAQEARERVRAAHLAERAAAGCACTGKHRRECALFKGKTGAIPTEAT